MNPYGPPPQGGYGYPQQPGYPPPQGFGGPTPDGYSMGPPTTHPLAIVSLIAGLVFCVPGAGLAAIICGFIGRSTIARNPNRYTGAGMALAGIILGFVHIAGYILYVVLVVALGVL